MRRRTLRKMGCRWGVKSKRATLICSAVAAIGVTAGGLALGDSLTWDPGSTPATPSGASGTWITNGTANWAIASSDVPWTDTTGTNTAVFGNVGGTVTLSGTDVANALVFSATGYTLSGGALTLAGTTPTITTNSNDTESISSPITDSGSFTTAGAGTLTLSGNNSNLTGNVNITAGKVEMGGYTALGPNSNTKTITVSSGAALDMNGYIAASGSGFFNTLNIAGTGTDGSGALLNSTTHQGLAIGVAQNPNVTLTADATVNLANPFAQIASGYSTTQLNLGGHTLTKTGSSNYYLINASISNGSINIAGGQIDLMGESNGGSSGTTITGTGLITISNGYLSLDSYQTANLITRPITISGGGLISTGNAQVDSPISLATTGQLYLEGGNMTLTGAISGTGGGFATNSYLDNGTHAVILTGANSYTGTTYINASTTLLANTPAASGSATGTSNVTIQSGGTLAGGTTAAPGNISGAVTVNSGATISAGTGSTTSSTIGKLTTGAETWSAGGTYAVKIGATNGSSDELNMAGLVNPSSGTFTIQLIGLSSSVFGGGYTYVIADDTALKSSTAFMLSSFVIATSGTAPAASNFALSETGDGGTGEELVLTNTTPEPSSAILLGVLAAIPLLGRKPRKRCVSLS